MENKIKCKCCGYEWESRKEVPKQCPKCKRYDYQKIKVGDDNVKN